LSFLIISQKLLAISISSVKNLHHFSQKFSHLTSVFHLLNSLYNLGSNVEINLSSTFPLIQVPLSSINLLLAPILSAILSTKSFKVSNISCTDLSIQGFACKYSCAN